MEKEIWEDDVNSPYNLVMRIRRLLVLIEELEEKAEELLFSDRFM